MLPQNPNQTPHPLSKKLNMESLCLWLYMLLLLVQYKPTVFSLMNNKNTSMNIHHLCHENERQLLLQLKQELSPEYPNDYYTPKYWKRSRDCCLWDGITCDEFTGHVIALDLSGSYLRGELESNSSLFHLAHLRSLNLAYNNFGGSAIPSEFGRLNALTHLNLSHANFGGEIPKEFYHLSGLLSLDLRSSDFTPLDLVPREFSSADDVSTLSCDIKMLFGNMTRLRVLLLAGLNLSNSELPMNMSSFLTHLDLGYTRISGKLSDSIGLMAKLHYMDLSYCGFWGPIPESIGNITAITFINLSGNMFSGGVPSTIANLTLLAQLIPSQNQLQGEIPDVISGLQNLTVLDLGYNYLQGRIPSYLTNMSQLTLLDISSNSLTGPFPSEPGHGLQHLRGLDLSHNSIQGMIQSWLFYLPSLEVLYLSSNRLTGRIGKLNSKTLKYLSLSYNALNIELQSFYNLTNIVELSISYNTVTELDGGDIVNVSFPNLKRLEISSCEIKEFPNYLHSNMPILKSLDLSNNNIHGPIPSWFTSNPLEYLSYLNLSYNSLTHAGDLPWRGLNYLDLHFNSLQGTFPSSICNMSYLFIINLSHNKLSGNIPECLANSSTQLEVLDLRRNEFHGKIPTTIGVMAGINYLGLEGNHFEGPLPPSMANCSNLQVIDLGNNMIKDTFPGWLHTLQALKILILKANSFHGSITSPAFTNNSIMNLQIFDLSYNNFTGLLPEKLFANLEAIKQHRAVSTYDGLYMESDAMYQFSVTLSVKGADVELTKVLKIFNTIDLSSNNFKGSIPESISNLTSLRLLNLSHNSIHGSIPPALGHMTDLEQLDLSSNQLTGGIPQSLTSLTFLGALNLSHNQLVGPIPQGNQFPTFSNESYAGNSGLCGFPLTTSCGEPPSTEEEDEDDDAFMMGFTWKTVVIGYGCGILLGFILGNILISIEKPRWLARFVYVEAAIILHRRRKRRRRVVQGAR